MNCRWWLQLLFVRITRTRRSGFVIRRPYRKTPVPSLYIIFLVSTLVPVTSVCQRRFFCSLEFGALQYLAGTEDSQMTYLVLQYWGAFTIQNLTFCPLYKESGTLHYWHQRATASEKVCSCNEDLQTSTFTSTITLDVWGKPWIAEEKEEDGNSEM